MVKKSVNPEWDEELTLSIEDPAVPIRLVCVRFLPSFLSQISCLGSFAPTLSNVYKYSEQKARKEKKYFTASINFITGLARYAHGAFLTNISYTSSNFIC